MLTSQILPSISTLTILGNVDAFISWMKKVHPSQNVDDMFKGYQFSLECCLNSFIDGICGDEKLEIESDFLFTSALSELIPLHQIKSSCEKTIFLKNVKPIVKSIIRAKTFSEIKEKMMRFNETISWRFEEVIKTNIHFSKYDEIGDSLAEKFWLIDYAHTFLVQINNDGPVANESHPFNTDWKSRERLEMWLEGYKYAIQFLWFQLLGSDQFNDTRLSRMHEADTWREYKYIEKEKSNDKLIDFLNQEFNLEEQTCFDSYFYWIQKEITGPFENRYGVSSSSIDNYFVFDSIVYDKQKLFKDLFNMDSSVHENPTLNPSDQIEELLYWYPIEVIDARESQMHQGIPAFNTMLAGTVTLFKIEKSSFDKVIVSKFTHPHSDDLSKNDYSYGVLVDSKSTAGHYLSGWIIYQDACGDYSGFSGSEHRSAEALIGKYSREGKIELREMTISLEEFSRFSNQRVRSKDLVDLHNENELLSQLLIDSKSILLELFTFHVFVREYRGKKDLKGDLYKVLFGTGKKSPEGEKDVVVESPNEVKLIECKLNPQTCNWPLIFKKLDIKSKSDKYQGKKVTFQLWFWYELSKESRKILDKAEINGEPVSYVVLSKPSKVPILKGVDLKKLSRIMDGEKTTEFMKPHAIWQSIVNANSYDNFKQFILPELYLKPSVPEEVRANVETIKQLLVHSYFEYNFTDVALTHAVFTLEKALKIRYREINNSAYRGNFKSLLNWFFERDYFETYNSGVLHQLRGIRNGKVHEEKNTLGGIIFLSKTKTPITLINDIYEDRELRRKRKDRVAVLQLELDKITDRGGILRLKGEKIIIEKTVVGFINNKYEQHKLSLVILPIYDPEIYLDNYKVKANRPTIELDLTNWKFSNNRFTATHDESEEVVLHPIMKDVNREKFLDWSKECESNQSLTRLNNSGANLTVEKAFLRGVNVLHKTT